jgi:long-chain acyl-CoA synthetase
MTFNHATILRESAAARPDSPLAYVGDRVLTYREVDQTSGRVATALRDLGLVPGDKVLVHLPNVEEFLYTYFGVLKAGLVLVPVNPLLTAFELNYHLVDSEARVVVTHATFADVVGEATADLPDVATFVVGDATGGHRPFVDLCAAEDRGMLHPTNADDTAILLYTSGTTGRPKGAQLTHFQIFMNCTVSGGSYDVGPEDVSIAVLPLFHVFGLSSVLNVAVRYGASVVLLPRFEPGAVLDAIEQHRCTIFAGVPAMFVALLHAEAGGRDVSSLRACISGGASIPGEVIRGFESKFAGTTILEGYGLSETASTATFNVSADQRKVLSIGKPIWGVEVKVVDGDGRELPPGADQVGELLIRGHAVTKGYHNKPEATEEAIRDGWLHTGDLGYRDQDGYLFLVDRLKDLVIRNGYNVYPREVEEVLYAHPDVTEAAVVGRPDARLGEEVVAYVVTRPGADVDEQELTAFARERLAAYKYPREFRFLPQLPKGATGKILKRELPD